MDLGVDVAAQTDAVPASDEPVMESAASRVGRGERIRWALLIGLPLFCLAVVAVLLIHRPNFYSQRIDEFDAEAKRSLSKAFLNKGAAWINQMQDSPNWQVDFEERQINAWLADDFQSNHAEQSLPKGVTAPRFAMEGDVMRLAFRYSFGPLSTVAQIGFRVWIPKRNMMAVELQGARAGGLPLPTNYTRHVIEQFCNNNGMDVHWKRNGKNLVALISFPRGQKEFVLRKVEVRQGNLLIRGSTLRSFHPGDYSPTAN